MQHISPSWHCGRNTRRGPSHRLKTNLLCLAALFLFALMPSTGWAQTTRSVSNAVAFRAALEDQTVTQITITGNFTLHRGHVATDGNGNQAYFNSVYYVKGSKTIVGGNRTIYRGTYRNNTIVLCTGAELTINDLTFDGQNNPNFAPLFCVEGYKNDDGVEIPADGQLIMNHVTIKNCVSVDPKAVYFGENTTTSNPQVPDATYLVHPKNPNGSNSLVNNAGVPVSYQNYNFTWSSSTSTGGAAIHFAPLKAPDDANNEIALTNCTFENNWAKYEAGDFSCGGAVFLGGSAQGGTFTGCTFKKNQAGIVGNNDNGAGGAVYFQGNLPTDPDKTFKFTGNTIFGGSSEEEKNKSYYSGGAIHIDGGNVVLEGTANISYNEALNDGGGISMYSGMLTIKENVTISNNTALRGGGILQSGGTLDINSTENTSSQTIKIENNEATVTQQTTIGTDNGGGGILVVGGTTTFTGTQTNPIQIINNKATNAYGGGILVYDAAPSFTCCDIGSSGKGNHAAKRGGGIYLGQQSRATFTNCNIDYNYTTSNDSEGGGVYNSYSTYDGTNTFANCNIHSNGDGENGTYKTTYGGGVYSIGKMELNSCTVSNNSATSNGGGLYMDSENAKLSNGCLVYENTANQGGGIYYKNGSFDGTNYVYYNTATTYGGGVFVEVLGDRTIDGLVIGSDDEEAVNKGNKAQQGGGVYTYSENNTNYRLTINGCKIVHNQWQSDGVSRITSGGGLCMANESVTFASYSHTVELTGGTLIDNNKAVNGGGVYLTNTGTLTLKLINTRLSNNLATENGGGIYNDEQTVTSANNNGTITFHGNRAEEQDGGGIYNNNGQVLLTGTKQHIFTENIADRSGGGIYNVGTSTCSLKNCQIGQSDNGNVAATSGGGIFVERGATTTLLPGVITFEGNHANYGGGLYNKGTVTQEVGCILTFDHNIADMNGGGVYHSGNPLTLTEAIFKNDTAYNHGGGIYTDSICSLQNCQIGQSGQSGKPNHAKNGGGIYMNGKELTIQGGWVSHNTASNNGGGIYLEQENTFVNNNCLIQNNVASNNGGGIYVQQKKDAIKEGNYKFSALTVIGSTNAIIGTLDIDKDTIFATTGEALAENVFIMECPYGFSSEPQKIFYEEGEMNIDGVYLTVRVYSDRTYFQVYCEKVEGSSEWPNDCKFILRFKQTDDDGVDYYLDLECGITYYEDGNFYEYMDSLVIPAQTIPLPAILTLNGSTVGGETGGNEATNGSGGGIYIGKDATANLTGSNVQSNTAGTFGGGVYISTSAIMGVSGAVKVEGNKTLRNPNDYPYLKYSKEDDVCLQSLDWTQANNTTIGEGGNKGKIHVLGNITGSSIGITEEQIAIGLDNNPSNPDRLHNYVGDIHRQFTINYGTHYTAKNATEIFFSNDSILVIKRLYPGKNTLGQTVTSTTNKLEVTLGFELNAWYVAGIWDDGNDKAPRYKWGRDDPLYGHFPDIPLRTLTGPNGVFARGYNPHTDTIFVVRAISIEEEARVRTTDDGKVIIRYPSDNYLDTVNSGAYEENHYLFFATDANNDGVGDNPIPIPANNNDVSMEVILHRYPGGHKLSSAFGKNVYDSKTSNDGDGAVPSAQAADSGNPTINETLKPGPNIGPVVQMDASNTTILYDVHMDGLAEFDSVQNTSYNPQGFYISPKSALLAVEDVTYSNNTTSTGTITLKETCELLWNNNKYGSDNSKELDTDTDAKFKREQRTGGAVFCAGTLVCEGTVIERNTCIDTTNTTTNGRGGGIYVKPGGSVTLDGCIVGSEGDAGNDETNKNMAQYGGGIYIDNIPYSDNGTPNNVSDDTPEKSGVVILTGQNAIQHNEATVKGGGVYKLGRLMIQDGTTDEDDKPLHITKNNIVSGTDENITYTLNNVHIPTESADDQTILITGALNCGSSVGVTKTKRWKKKADQVNASEIDTIPEYSTQGEHVYERDLYFQQVNTPIAQVSSTGEELWAEDAFYKRIFFDDKGYYRVWSFDFYNYGDGEDYSDQKDYFIETWRSYANNGTDHVELDNNNKLVKKVKSPQGFAYFAKQVNDGEDYSGVDLCQTTTIDLDGHHWEPIGYTFCGGCETEADRPFAGTYNGNGHFILNAISILPEKEMGLFGNVTGTLKHTFTVGDQFYNTHDHAFTNDSCCFASLGAIVGNTTSTIDGCEAANYLLHVHYPDNDGTIAAGGIAGNVGGTGEVRNSFTSHINFSEDCVSSNGGGFQYCGGLVGNIASGGKVKNCYTKVNSAEPIPESYAAIVGHNDNTQSGNFTNCYTSATSGKIVGSGTAGTNVYSAGATGATATYTVPIGADHLGYMCIDNGVATFEKTNLVEGKDYFKFNNANGTEVELIPLFRLLNLNAKALNNSNNYTLYAEWARPALAFYEGLGESASTTGSINSPINGDLPLLMLNNYDGSTHIGQGGFRSVGTYGGGGDVLQYGGPDRDGNELDAALTRPKVTGTTGDDYLFVYGDVKVAPAAELNTFTQAKVSIYEHAAISRAGTLAGFNQTYVGVTFDNSGKVSGSATNGINYIDNGPGLPRNWHMLSTPLTNAPLGFRYGDANDSHNGPVDGSNYNTVPYNASGYYNNPWGGVNGSNDPNSPSNTEFSWLGNSNYATGHTRYWMHGWDNSRVSGTHDNSTYPANTWVDGYFPSKVNTSAIQFGEQLFIPFANNNGSNEYVGGNHRYPYGMDFYSWTEPDYHYINFKRNGPNHWHSDAPHVHLDYTPEEASNNSGATAFGQNVNETTLLDGKGYMASIHIPTFLQTSGTLGGEPYGQTPDDDGEEPGPEPGSGKGSSGDRNALEKSIAVTYNENDLDLCEGWNLVGNPFHAYLDFNALCEANIGTIADDTYVVYNADGFGSTNNDGNSGNYGNGFSYYVKNGSTGGAYAHQHLHPHQGFFVKVNEYEENTPTPTLTFKESHTTLRSDLTANDGSYRDDSRPAYPLVNLFLTSDKGCSDVCVVEFNRPEWGGATKLRDMYSGNGLFYAAHDNGNYAALFATPEAERIPLKFEAKDEAGDTYTIHWNTQNGDFHKLYLVDNITGVQYDMLRNSSYSFSGKKDDYWTRFYITFEVTGLDEEQDDEDDDASTGSASTTFAFFDGSQWVVTNDGHGTATLDLIDLQGRVLHSTTLAEGQARIGLPDVAKGMYLMRMTNQNGMFVQKIVVR